MESFVEFYGSRQPQDAAGVFFPDRPRLQKEKKYDELAPGTLEDYLKSGRRRVAPIARSWPTSASVELAWKASCPKASEDVACLESKRVTATGRQKVIDDLNKKLKKREDQEAKRNAVRLPTKSKIVVFDRDSADGESRRSTSRPSSRSGRGA